MPALRRAPAVLPFAATPAEREGARDPRPSLQERYASPAVYAAAVEAAAGRLEAEGLLLAEDVAAINAAAAADTGALARLAHALAGASAQLGRSSTALACRALERAARAGRVDLTALVQLTSR